MNSSPPSGLTYAGPVNAVVGVALQPVNPTVTGSVTGYTVSPALPAGISINDLTGIISGTPTAVVTQANYTVTAMNAYGSTTFSLSAKVDAPPPSAYSLSKLVSDGSVAAAATDPHLKNPWGIAALAGGPNWVANNHDQTSTIYDGTGLVQALVVSIPAGANGVGAVTGMIASSSTTDFTVTNGTVTAPARFIFVTESGTIAGWAPTVNATTAVNAYDDAAGGAIYKGLAMAANGGSNFLYAADFHNNRIQVFNSTFTKVTATGGFADPTLPVGYAPFNIQAVQVAGSTVLVVAYAKQDATASDEEAGAGLGLVNTFDVNGTLLKHLVPAGGKLNAPWGIALAPANFGTLSGALLVGNFGDGKINGYDVGTGAFIHSMNDSAGNAIVNEGLWGITFGNGARNQPTTTLYLVAGINGENGGLYARIDLGATAPDVVAPTGVAITTPVAVASVSGSVPVTANAADNVGVAKVVFSTRVGSTTTDIATVTAAPFTATWNTGSTANGSVTLIATAYDAFGNTTASPGVAVTVNNVPDVTPPTVTLTAPVAGNVSGTVTVTATAADNIGVAQVRFLAGTTVIGTATTAPYTVQWNTTGLSGAVQLTAEAKDGAGNLTTSAAVPVTVGNAPTLASLQSAIFGPRCSSCHNGAGASLPGSMNLSSAAATASALINVTSQEVGSLKRVTPSDPGNSYVVQKLEGTNAVGVRMPFGGPYLDQATINQVRDWIQAGAAP
ncbi:MAG: TIGR03118 family protein [Pseudomonadota bacterium]